MMMPVWMVLYVSLRFVTVQMRSGLNTPGTSRYYKELGTNLGVHEFQPGGKLIKATDSGARLAQSMKRLKV